MVLDNSSDADFLFSFVIISFHNGYSAGLQDTCFIVFYLFLHVQTSL